MERKLISPALLLGMAPAAILVALVLSVMYGAKPMHWTSVRDALLHFDAESLDHQILFTSRLPRALGAFLIGGFLAISGAVMQGMTRNDLASPSVMGVSDGAAFIITLCMILIPNASAMTLISFSFVGSLAAVVLVFGMSWLIPGGMSPVRMAVLGTIIGVFLSSISSALSIYFHVSQNVSFWFNARLHQMDLNMMKLAIPLGSAGILAALLLSRSITILSLGDEVSAGLGQKNAMVKAGCVVTVALLTGISVALAGKIAFVGLLIPHMVRYLVGVDYRWVIPCSGVIGGVFLTLSDVMSRFMNYPFETPVGVVTAAFGVPFFLYLIRRKGGQGHA